MRKINLESYKVKVPEVKDGKFAMVETDWKVKDSIVNLLFHNGQQLGRQDIRIREKIATKIEAAEKEIYLEDSEFSIVNSAFDTFKGFGRNDNELIRRIDEAETVTPEQLLKRAEEIKV